jgi:hypothetical protein
MMKERFRLTFACGEPGCDKTAVVLYDARPAETLEQLRQRNPIFLAVLCGAKHFGNYSASAAIYITVPAPSKWPESETTSPVSALIVQVKATG